MTDADARANPSSTNYQAGRAQGQEDVINNPKGYGISANKNSYTDQTLTTPMINDHNRGTFTLTATNLTRIDAIVSFSGMSGDDWCGGGSVTFSGNIVTIYDYGSGANGNNGNHYDTVVVRQYHAFD